MNPDPVLKARIQKLSPRLANQIAAGEVVERPASVVKELLENCLDAEATQISIDIEGGGITGIKIRDNGNGIHSDDLPLAVSSHATSKIISIDDLEQVLSLGFRGEALASIAAVAKFSLSSKTKESLHAMAVECRGQTMQPHVHAIAHPDGTTVEVRDLFYNTPARKKFLKSENTEREHIERVIKKVALSHFHVALQYRYHDKLIFQWPVAETRSQKEQRMAKILGKAFIEQAIFFETAARGVQVWGWVGHPSFSQSHSDHQYFFINKRMVRDRVLMHAVKNAYDGVIEEGRYPAYVLNLEIDPKEVDVNVHPTKSEVRFHDSNFIHDFLSHSLKKALHHHEATDEPAACLLRPKLVTTLEMFPDVLTPENITQVEHSVPDFKILSFLFQRYLIVEEDKDIWCIDVVLEKKNMILLQIQEMILTSGVSTKALLWPRTLALALDLKQQALNLQKTLLALGFHFTEAGPKTVMIREIPTFFPEEGLESFFESLLQAPISPNISENGPIWEKMALFSAESMVNSLSVEALESFYKAVKAQEKKASTKRLLHADFFKSLFA